MNPTLRSQSVLRRRPHPQPSRVLSVVLFSTAPPQMPHCFHRWGEVAPLRTLRSLPLPRQPLRSRTALDLRGVSSDLHAGPIPLLLCEDAMLKGTRDRRSSFGSTPSASGTTVLGAPPR